MTLKVLGTRKNTRSMHAAVAIQAIAELFGVLKSERLHALIPIVVMLLLFAVTMFAVNAVAPLAPFVYSFF